MCIKDMMLGLAVGMGIGVVIYSNSVKTRGFVAKTKKAISEKLKEIADNM